MATLHEVDPLDGARSRPWPRRLGVDLVVVGPEAPLVAGVADAVRAAGVACFGPSREAARLEGSKAFAKEVMDRRRGPDRAGPASAPRPRRRPAALDEFGAPYVVKDDGLAAGKGVVVTDDRAAALAHADEVRAGGDRGVPRRSGGLAVRHLRRVDRVRRCSRRRTSSASSTATGARTPAGMGAYTPLPWAPAGLVERGAPHGAAADRRRDGPPRHAVRRPALRRPRAHLPRAPGSWSSTPASVTPRPSR